MCTLPLRRDTYEKTMLYYVERHIKGYFKCPGMTTYIASYV